MVKSYNRRIIRSEISYYMGKKWQFNEETIKRIIFLYSNEIKSINYIAKLFQVDNSVIKRILKEKNIEIRDNNIYKSKSVDNTFFDIIDTEEKAYWLGFVYADGYVTKSHNSLVFGVSLSVVDLCHLQKLKDILKSEHKIVTGIDHTTYGDINFCKLCIVNSHLVNSLIDKGVYFNKSKILEPPTEKQVPNHLIPHFIRGYFDGDGSVYEYHKTHEGSISFVGTENMLNWILTNLKTKVHTNASVYKYKNKDIYELKIGGINNFFDCYEYLYKNATIYLERKYNKYQNILTENNKIDVQRL